VAAKRRGQVVASVNEIRAWPTDFIIPRQIDLMEPIQSDVLRESRSYSSLSIVSFIRSGRGSAAAWRSVLGCRDDPVDDVEAEKEAEVDRGAGTDTARRGSLAAAVPAGRATLHTGCCPASTRYSFANSKLCFVTARLMAIKTRCRLIQYASLTMQRQKETE
jgi:hypothetical protein